MGKGRKKGNGMFIVDIKIEEVGFKPVMRGRFVVPSLEDLAEILKRKIG